MPERKFFVVVCLTMCIAAKSRSQAIVDNVEFLGGFGGYARSIAVFGDLAFLGCGQRVVILDISKPGEPELLSRVEVFGAPLQVFVQDSLMAVSAGYAGMRLFDISDPRKPVFVSNYHGLNWVRHVHLSGSLAYVLGGFRPQYLHIVSIQHPGTPYMISSLEMGNSFSLPNNEPVNDPAEMVLVGSTLYVGGGNAIALVDVSNPSLPSLVRPLIGLEGPFAFKDTYAFGVAGDLVIFDLVDPAPEAVFFDEINSPELLEVDGDRLYAFEGYNRQCIILDISNAENPVVLTSFTPEPPDAYSSFRPIVGMTVVGDEIFFADSLFGLYSYDISDIHAPVRKRTFDEAFIPNVYAARGNLILAGGHHEQTALIDTSDPNCPRKIPQNEISNGSAEDAALGETLAAVHRSASNSVEIYNLQNPAAPQLMSVYPEGGEDMLIAGDVMYQVNLNEFSVIDLSNPSQPEEVISIPARGYDPTLSIDGNALLLSGFYDGSVLFDVSDPLNPIATGNLDERVGVLMNGFAYVHDYQRFRVYNVADLSDPVLVFDADLVSLGSYGRFTVGRDFVFTINNIFFKGDLKNPYFLGTYLEIASPGIPVARGGYGFPATYSMHSVPNPFYHVYGVQGADDLVVVNNLGNGLLILRPQKSLSGVNHRVWSGLK